MGRIKLNAQRSPFAIAEEARQMAAASQHVETGGQNAEPQKSEQVPEDSEQRLALEPETGPEPTPMSEPLSDPPPEDNSGFEPESYAAQDVPMSDAGFEYNDDDVDDDFEDDQEGDSDYEEGPSKRRRGNQKPPISKKAAKPAKPSKPTKAAKPKKPTTLVNKSTARNKKARGGTDQAPRALEKARRDVKLKISKGQPPDVGDRALRCLPYRTRNRAPKRELMRWNEDTYQQTLLAMVWVQEVRDIAIPWDEIAAVVHPGATGEAFKQALAKLRTKRVKDDLPVPPLRPGKDRPRQDCVEELENIMAEAQQARDRNAGKVKARAKAVASNTDSGTDESSDDKEKSAKPKKKVQSSRKRPVNYDDGGEPSVEDDTEYDGETEASSSTVRPYRSSRSPLPLELFSPPQSSSDSSEDDNAAITEEMIKEYTTDLPSSLTFQVVTGRLEDLHPRPSRGTARVQARVDGLNTEMDIPGRGTIIEKTGKSSMPPPPRPSNPTPTTASKRGGSANHGRPGHLAAPGQQFPPVTPPPRRLSMARGAFNFPPSTPSSSINDPLTAETPRTPPPAPGSRSRSRSGGLSKHSRKRSGDAVGLSGDSPAKRRQSDASIRAPLSRRPSLSQIPETPYQISPATMGPPGTVPPGMLTSPTIYGHARQSTVSSGSFGGAGMGPAPFGYGDMGMGMMHNQPLQYMNPAYMNMMHGYGGINLAMQQQAAYQQAAHQQAAFQNSPADRRMTNPQPPVNVNPGLLQHQAGHQMMNSESGLTNVNPRLLQMPQDEGSGDPTSSGPSSYIPFAAFHGSGHQDEVPSSAMGQDESQWHLPVDVHPYNQWNDSYGPPAAGGYNDLSRLSEDVKPDGGDEQTQQFSTSQNTTFGGPSTQDSFGSNVEGSRITPSNPRPGTGDAIPENWDE